MGNDTVTWHPGVAIARNGICDGVTVAQTMSFHRNRSVTVDCTE